jgi:hypothetical protein
LQKERALNIISFLRYIFRFFLYKFSFISVSVSKLLRFFLSIFSCQSDLIKILSDFEVKFAISVSITNSSDAIFLICAKKLGIYSIATTRSWDNLSSHGSILVEPDVFINHSQFMKQQLLLFQNLSKNCKIMSYSIPIYDFDTISYLKFITSNSSSNRKPKLKILYACTGSYHFPNEFMYAIEMTKSFSNFGHDFSVLQHPKSIHKVNDTELNNKTFMFPYISKDLRSTISEYYNFLTKFDLIIGSGSTVLLDACYLRIPVVGFFPDNTDNFWTSISRYSDFMYHYNQFLEKIKIPIIKDLHGLVEFVADMSEKIEVNMDNVNFFTGNSKSLYFNEIIDRR